MPKCYYLVYKLKKSPILWIVNVMDNPYHFFDEFNNVVSYDEKYYIILKQVEDIEKNCQIISESKLL
jgi:hypothetical protein